MATSLPATTRLYGALNREFFGGELPPCQIRWSQRLTRSAGNIRVESRVIALSVPLLIDAYKDGASFLVCGVPCDDREAALREILKHEMIHLWLHEKGLPCGHTREFRAKARQIGQPKTRHGIGLAPRKVGWIYACPHCGAQITRQRRINRAAACAECCKKFNGGKFDAKFALTGRRAE